MNDAVQLDLFGEVQDELDAIAAHRDHIAAWRARFERKPWIAPYDCAGGLKEGESALGWVCPGCGEIEINEFLLATNHGWDPNVAREPRYSCLKQLYAQLRG